MIPLPSFVSLRTPSALALLDLTHGRAELVYLGGPLSVSEDPAMLAAALRQGAHESQPDGRPAAPLLLDRTAAMPAIALSRNGRALFLEPQLTQAEASERTLELVWADAQAGIRLTLRWSVEAGDLFASTMRVENLGDAPLGIERLMSLALPLPRWADRLTRYSGRWAAEMQAERLALPPGIIGGVETGGRPGFGGANWMVLDGADGRTLGAHLAWSGGHESWITRDEDDQATLCMGPRLEQGEISLKPGEAFETPRALFLVTEGGHPALMQAFHDYARAVMPARTTPRKVHLNSWEALGFDLDPAKLERLAQDAAALGVERFVLDDGWFAGRRDDTTSLGDWTPDPAPFPHGLGPLIAHVRELGMDFGLWVEPEMVSPDSALYRAHPDWCLHLPGRSRPTQRHQLVLNLTLPDVQAHLRDRLGGLLRDDDIAYLKWDHNRDLYPAAGAGHAQTLALYRLLDELRASFPHVEIESCASGGGRVDLEILRRCDRYWASDNNDAVERLAINTGWLQFLPLAATGNHVGPSPNPITGRRLAMDFRAKVAMFGHMGVEADPAAMSADDRACLARHIALYKEWRKVLHGGRLFEICCEDDGTYGWLALAGDKGLALAASTRMSRAFHVPPVRFSGLEPERPYRVRLLEPWPEQAVRYLAGPDAWREGHVLSGRALDKAGLALPLHQPETAWLIAMEAL